MIDNNAFITSTPDSSKYLTSIVATAYVFPDKAGKEMLKISADGAITYKGRKLGSDKEIFAGLQEFFKGHSCLCEDRK